MRIEQLDSDDPARPEGPTLFESAAWQAVLEKAYDFTFYRAVHDGGESPEQASLPFATANRALRPRVLCLPFSDFVATGDLPVEACGEIAEAIRRAHPDAPLVVKTTYAHDADLPGRVVQKGYTHAVPTPSHEAVDAGLSSSFRGQTRQAKEQGVTVERSQSAASLARFYDLHRRLRFGKFGKIPQPRRFFRAIRETFFDTDRGFVLEARHDGATIAALVALRHEDVLYYKFSASDEDELEHRPNNRMLHALLHHAVDAECSHVDLGYSGAGPEYRGLRRFKESLGGEPRPITAFRCDPPGYDPAADDELNDLLSRLTDTVVDHELGPDATDDFSRLLYPYFA